VRSNAGDGKGKGVFARSIIEQGYVAFEDEPVISMQHSASKEASWACDRCMKRLGSLGDRDAFLGTAGGRVSGSSSSSRVGSGSAVVRCRGGCSECYCCTSCETVAWRHYHHLLCCGPLAGGDREGDDPGRHYMREFNDHADSTNDIFRLAARFYAMIVASLLKDKGEGSSKTGSGAGSDSAESSAASFLDAIRCGWKAPWWSQVALPHDVEDEDEFRSQLKELAGDSFALLRAALKSRIGNVSEREEGSLFSLDVYGSLVGMFELNNLEIFLHNGELEGTGFYPLHSMMNHSCEPNVSMFYEADEEEGEEGDYSPCSKVYAYALRDIEEGEEITCSYLDAEQLELETEERQDLLRDYGFRCTCSSCT